MSLTSGKYPVHKHPTPLPAQKNPRGLRLSSTVQRSRRLRPWERRVGRPPRECPRSPTLCREPSTAAAEEAAHRLPVWREREREQPQATPSLIYYRRLTNTKTYVHLVLEVQCVVTDVPNLDPACCVSSDQGGVFKLIWGQAQHTLTRLVWSVELTWNREEKVWKNVKKTNKIQVNIYFSWSSWQIHFWDKLAPLNISSHSSLSPLNSFMLQYPCTHVQTGSLINTPMLVKRSSDTTKHRWDLEGDTVEVGCQQRDRPDGRWRLGLFVNLIYGKSLKLTAACQLLV